MGLFDFMRRSFPRGRNESQPRVAKTTPQSCGHKGEILFHGDEESIVYCYDGAPLKGLKEGSEIYLDVLPYDVVMESCDTGTVIDTKEWEIPAVGYLGRPIGTLQFTFDYFKALAFDGYSVKVKAKKIGMYSTNIPELVLLTPPKVELRQWWNSRKFFGRPIPFGKAICVVINGAYIENDINPIPKASRIEILKEPLKDGSKSKPDIVVYADGVPFTRFKYKRYAYEELERMISNGIVECGIDLHEDFETERKYRLYIASE